MSLQPFLVNPVVVNPASSVFHGFTSGIAGSGGLAQFYVPVLFQGGLYQFLQDLQGGTKPINMWRSPDRGATWSILDGGNAPTKVDNSQVAGMFFDGNHTAILAWSPTSNATTPATGPLNLKNFDLSTNTWGPTYATAGAPNVYLVEQCFQRPDGSILVLAAANAAGGSVFGTTAFIFSGGIWTTVAVDANIPGPRVSSSNIAACMDSTGRVHLFMIARDIPPTVPAQWFYQLINTDNSLGTFAVIQTGVPPTGNLPGVPLTSPCISGNNVLFGLTDDGGTYPTISVGTPLNAPVFTRVSAPGIDPNVPTTNVHRLDAPALAADATGIYAAYLIQAPDLTYTMRLAFSPNLNAPLTGWNTSILAFDANATAIGDPTGWQALGLLRTGGNLFASAVTPTANIIGPESPTQYWLGGFTNRPGMAITLRGVNRFKVGECSQVPVKPTEVTTEGSGSRPRLPVRMR